MRYDPETHHRRSIRLKGYDYTSPGAYFVTLCAQERECLFGDIVDGEMRLNGVGRIVAETWAWLGKRYPYVTLDAYVVMPNHLHGVIVISDDDGRGGSRTAPTTTSRKPLGRLVGAFKTVSAKHINGHRGTPGAPVRQRNYYEHIIRSEAALDRIRRYIYDNPGRWTEDDENPDRV